ncbi:MAG TPA: hypothetical protein VGN72_16675 [Tepidisphaeraceae bacterium]|jgi:hypothetical protein|nr:hypothetical protein [Tepidisphaeraceae bacterium]
MPTNALDAAVATAADYADALLTARRFKTVLFFVILIALLLELTLFFLARYDVIPTTVAPGATANPTLTLLLQYLTVIGTFLGLTGSIILSFVLLLIATIMLVGRLIGVGRITSAYIWCVILIVLLFPWQAIYVNPTLLPAGQEQDKDFRIPGVLYTWTELSHPQLGANFDTADTKVAALRWARFVGFPALAIIVLLITQLNSGRALKQALGENEPDRDVHPRAV